MRIFHIATVTDWDLARTTGRYTTSTRGRTLAEEGFIHASRADQWQGVRERFYADVDESLVLLVIDSDLLSAPVVEEPVADSTETFPHVYGAIDVAAVVQVLPLPTTAQGSTASTAAATAPTALPGPPVPVEQATSEPSPSFSRLFLAEVLHNLLLATIVLVVVVAATLVGVATDLDWAPLAGAALGLVVGVLAARAVHARRS